MTLERKLKQFALTLALWSYTALVVTGEFRAFVVIALYAAYFVYVFRPELYRKIGEATWTALNIMAFPLSLGCAFFDLGTALIAGTCYLQLQKLARAKSSRDYAWLVVISFFQVALAAAISAELTFLMALSGFLFLVVLSLAFLTLERGREETEKIAARMEGVGVALTGLPPLEKSAVQAAASSSRSTVPPSQGTDLPPNYPKRLAIACLGSAVIALCLFVCIPRLIVERNFLRLRPLAGQLISGFSDEIVLDGSGSIHKDQTLLMRVWPSRESVRHYSGVPPVVRLRGVALDFFDSTRWSISPAARQQAVHQRNCWARKFDIPFYATSSHRGELIVLQDLDAQPGWLFAPPFLTNIEFAKEMDIEYYRELHSIRARSPFLQQLEYRVKTCPLPSLSQVLTSHTAAVQQEAQSRAPEQGPGMPWVMSKDEREHYLNLPGLLPELSRLRAIAADLTKDAKTPFERVSRFNRFLHEHFHYSTKVPDVRPSLRLIHFLETDRAGHCEMFATAMAVLCRLAGVPARVAVGFYSNEYNPYEKVFYIRHGHAHSWVEVWLDGFGWFTVDPTPPSALDRERSRWLALMVLADRWELWTLWWRRYVVDYSLADQVGFFVGLRRLLRRSPLAALASGHMWRSMRRRNGGDGFDGIASGFALLAVIVAGLAGAWLSYRWKKRWNGLRRKRPTRGAVCPVAFYAQILAALARAGWRRPTHLTPGEFARLVASRRPDLFDFVPLTQTYYRVRFAGDVLKPTESARISEFLTRLSK